MPVLQAESLVKNFGDITAVDDVNFSIEDNEFISIVGPSGSGKTTILRMLAGFEKPSEGNIILNGESAVDKPPFSRDVNMVFQDLALFPHLDVKGNIKYGLKQKGVKKEKQERAVKESLEMVHLSGYEDRDITELSGGEQQRVALARAIVNEPEIVLFDEPLASLDRKLRQHMKFELQRIQEETGITFLYVTHDQEIALSVSDRIIVLNDGHIEQIGSSEELYKNPDERFVAEFIGDINVIEGRVTSFDDKNAMIEIDGAEDSITANSNGLGEIKKGQGVWGCIRPEDVQFMQEGVTLNSHLKLEGEIENKMYLGDHLEMVANTDIGELQMKVSEDDNLDTNPDIGDIVEVGFRVNNIHWFEKEQ